MPDPVLLEPPAEALQILLIDLIRGERSGIAAAGDKRLRETPALWGAQIRRRRKRSWPCSRSCFGAKA